MEVGGQWIASVDAVIIGMGYVGLPLAREASAAGLSVIGLDTNPEVVDGLNHGRSHIDDLGDSDVAEMLERGFFASIDARQLRRAQTIVVCVPTPLSSDGAPDLAPLRAAAVSVAEHLQPRTLVILESTTYPGTTDEEIRPILEAGGMAAGRTSGWSFAGADRPRQPVLRAQEHAEGGRWPHTRLRRYG